VTEILSIGKRDMAQSEETDLSPLVGSWRLKSYESTFSDTGERTEPYGANPVGSMVLAASGRIVFLFGKSDRRPPASDLDKASLFNSLMAYTGTVRRDGADRLVTTVGLALNPTFSGDQIRFFTLDGDRLTLCTPASKTRFSGDRLVTMDLVWIRE
jgi:hypothetical protein